MTHFIQTFLIVHYIPHKMLVFLVSSRVGFHSVSVLDLSQSPLHKSCWTVAAPCKCRKKEERKKGKKEKENKRKKKERKRKKDRQRKRKKRESTVLYKKSILV